MADIAADGATVFTKVDHRGRQRIGRLLAGGTDVFNTAGGTGPEGQFTAEALILVTEWIVDAGFIGAEAALVGFVDPELGNLIGEAFLIGSDQLRAPTPTTRLVKTKGGPVTWER